MSTNAEKHQVRGPRRGIAGLRGDGRRLFRSIRCAGSTPMAALPPPGAGSYTALVVVPLAAIGARLSLSATSTSSASFMTKILSLVFKFFIPSIGEQAGWWFRALCQFGGTNRWRRSGSSASPPPGCCSWSRSRTELNLDLAGDRTTPVGAAGARLLDLDHAGAAAGGAQPVIVDLFRDRRAPGRVQPGGVSSRLESGWLHGAARTVPALPPSSSR